MNLIPLGMLNKELVDVSDVKEDDKGSITCPSCESELIAKKGDVMIHHFAHKAGTQNTKACEYSFFVSVVRAFKEHSLKKEDFSLKLPELSYSNGGFSKRIQKEEIVNIGDFDLTTEVTGGFTFIFIDNGIKTGVSLKWEDSNNDLDFSLVDNAVTIYIDSLSDKYNSLKLGSTNFSFKRMITSFILLDAPREYINHNRLSDVKTEIDNELKEHEEQLSLATLDSILLDTDSKNQEKLINVDPLCIICRGDKGSKPLIDDNVCFKCVEKHFYMKNIFRLHKIKEIVSAKYLPSFI